MNDDAHAILADMGDGEDLKGAKLDVAVNAIVGSLVRNGYLESISSAIMISVEDRDQSRAHRLQQDLSAARVRATPAAFSPPPWTASCGTAPLRPPY